MKIKIIEKRPQKIKVKILDTGQVAEYAPNFFKKRIGLGVFEIVNEDEYRNKI